MYNFVRDPKACKKIACHVIAFAVASKNALRGTVNQDEPELKKLFEEENVETPIFNVTKGGYVANAHTLACLDTMTKVLSDCTANKTLSEFECMRLNTQIEGLNGMVIL